MPHHAQLLSVVRLGVVPRVLDVDGFYVQRVVACRRCFNAASSVSQGVNP